MTLKLRYIPIVLITATALSISSLSVAQATDISAATKVAQIEKQAVEKRSAPLVGRAKTSLFAGVMLCHFLKMIRRKRALKNTRPIGTIQHGVFHPMKTGNYFWLILKNIPLNLAAFALSLWPIITPRSGM